MVLWAIASRVFRYMGNKKDHDIDKNLKSASDRAIKIANMPYGEYNEEELLEYYQRLREKKPF
jgi:hypothetical protein